MKGLNVKDEIYALLKAKGCTLEETNGIVIATTPSGLRWDFTVPSPLIFFLEEGTRVRAKMRIYDLPGTADPGPIRAESGDLGTVEHVEEGVLPTVRFDRTGGATCVTHEEVEEFNG